MDDLEAVIAARIEASRSTQKALLALAGLVAEAGRAMVERLRAGGRVLLCGNGGSASDALHIAGELSGRFLLDRPPLPALALTGNPAALTAIANDYGYDQVFARQVKAHGSAGDVVIGLSTSGNSPNVVEALRETRKIGALAIALTGEGGGNLVSEADFCIQVPSRETPRIQESHILIGHILCEIIETSLFGAV